MMINVIINGSVDVTIVVWDLATGEIQCILNYYSESIMNLQFNEFGIMKQEHVFGCYTDMLQKLMLYNLRINMWVWP